MQMLYIPPSVQGRMLRAHGCNRSTVLKMTKVSSLKDTPLKFWRVAENSIINKEYKKKCSIGRKTYNFTNNLLHTLNKNLQC
jgi:hypothetical protein